MYRIEDMYFGGQLKYGPRTISGVIPADITVEQEQTLRNAKLLEVLDQDEKVIGSYSLVSWLAEEVVPGGLKFTWQTYLDADVKEIRDLVDEHSETLEGNTVELSDILVAITELGDLLAELLPEPEPDPDPEPDPEPTPEEGGEEETDPVEGGAE